MVEVILLFALVALIVMGWISERRDEKLLRQLSEELKADLKALTDAMDRELEHRCEFCDSTEADCDDMVDDYGEDCCDLCSHATGEESPPAAKDDCDCDMEPCERFTPWTNGDDYCAVCGHLAACHARPDGEEAS